MNEKIQNVLKIYCRRGWKLFPVIPKTKRPAIKDNLNAASDDFSQLLKWSEKFPGCNWAVACSRSGLVAVDVDFKHGGVEAWDALLEEHKKADEVLPNVLRAVSGSGARHYVFKASEGAKYRGKIKDGIDIMFNGYIVVFPSTHPETKKKYTWVNWKNHDKDAEPPKWLAKYLEKTALKGKANPTFKFGDDYLGRLVAELKKHELDYHEWVQAGMALHAAEPSDVGRDLFIELSQGESYEPGDEEKACEKWESFKRSGEEGSISPLTLGFLVRQKGGVVPNPHYESDKEAFKKAKIDSFESWVETNETEDGFVEDEDDAETWVCTNKRAIVKHFNRKGFAYLGEGEQRFSVIKVSKDGSGVKKLKAMTSRGMIEATREYQYKYLKVMATDVKLVKEPAADIWLGSKNKARFVVPCFNPDPDASPDKGRINLFEGIPCKKITRPPMSVAGLPEFIAMIKDSLCGGDDNASEWLLSFLAHALQRPHEKPTVVPVIVGPQGTGKGLLFDYVMRAILKDLFLTVKTAKDLTAQFNTDLANRLLTVIDEATWRGNKTEDGVLKNLTGGNRLTVEVKFGPKYETENFSRYAITSNNEEAVAIETSNRRYYPIESSDEFAGNSDYFDPIWQAARKGDLIEAFYTFLMARDISAWNPVAIPAGNLKGSSAKVRTGGVVSEFWNDLFNGHLESSPWSDERTLVNKKAFDAFIDYAKKTNTWEKSLSAAKFWHKTKDLIPEIPTGKQRARLGGRTTPVKKIKVSEAFESYYFQNQIEKPSDFHASDLVGVVDFDEEPFEPDFEI
jgi:hypothetical protein